MNQDTGRMLEQSSKTKYEYKLTNLLINSLSLTGTDVKFLFEGKKVLVQLLQSVICEQLTA